MLQRNTRLTQGPGAGAAPALCQDIMKCFYQNKNKQKKRKKTIFMLIEGGTVDLNFLNGVLKWSEVCICVDDTFLTGVQINSCWTYLLAKRRSDSPQA